MAPEDKGFVAALFDFSFSSFVTTKLIKLLYGIVMFLAGVGALTVLLNGFRHGMPFALIGLIACPIAFFIWVLIGRVWLELVIVMFRIAENVGKIAEQKSGGASSKD